MAAGLTSLPYPILIHILAQGSRGEAKKPSRAQASFQISHRDPHKRPRFQAQLCPSATHREPEGHSAPGQPHTTKATERVSCRAEDTDPRVLTPGDSLGGPAHTETWASPKTINTTLHAEGNHLWVYDALEPTCRDPWVAQRFSACLWPRA